MTSKSWITLLGAPLLAIVLAVAPPVSSVHAVEDAHKVGVVSFGLFGDQGVFRSEAAGAAQVVASRSQWVGRRERCSVFDSHLARLPSRPGNPGGAALANAHAD